MLTSPEMSLLHDGFRQYLSDAAVSKQLVMIVIDEAHCISQWGGDFRKEYSQLDRLKPFFPTHIPFLAVSATLNPAALRDVQNSLGFELDDAFFLNRGNDRPNITMSVQHVRSPTDYEALLPLITTSEESPTRPDQLQKTIVFVNSVKSAQHCKRWIKQHLPENLRGYVDTLHAQRTVGTRRRVMKDYRENRVRILIATEAAGMGADIPDIKLIIQLGVPSSLAVWIQRAGRAARSPTLHGRAILLVEPSVFQVVKKADGIGTQDEYKKNVEPAMRKWIETTGCRRDVVDEYFANPPGIRQMPTGDCCDNDAGISTLPPRFPTPASRAATPDSTASSPPGSAPGSPNCNGKRPMLQPAPFPMSFNEPSINPKKPSRRQKEHLANVKAALITFRFDMKEQFFSTTSYTSYALLPERLLTSFASHRTVETLKDLEEVANTRWVFGKLKLDDGITLFDKALDVVREQDRVHEEKKAAAKQAKADKTAARRAAKKQARAEEKRVEDEAKRDENERKRVEQEERDRIKALEEEMHRREQLRMGFSSFSSSPCESTASPMMFESQLQLQLVGYATPTPRSRSSRLAKENIPPQVPPSPPVSSPGPSKPRPRPRLRKKGDGLPPPPPLGMRLRSRLGPAQASDASSIASEPTSMGAHALPLASAPIDPPDALPLASASVDVPSVDAPSVSQSSLVDLSNALPSFQLDKTSPVSTLRTPSVAKSGAWSASDPGIFRPGRSL
ncbi:hypothetical protein NMY22_g2725 [Coprinellus aureogranulatus]|nr:hypothetical protein NMY22_g2725 [Coprinellus aureogranulatus]